MSRRSDPLTEILIVTPVLNGVSTIGRTLLSVAAQAGPVRLIHHVQDGGSDDGTQAILDRWARLAAWGGIPATCTQYRFSWSSEADSGLYDAVARGFSDHEPQAEQWLSWINADDILTPAAAGLLAAVDRDCEPGTVNWVAGKTRVARDGQVLTEHDRPVCREIIQEGLCDGLHFPLVQQEGVFFRRQLWSRIDAEQDFARFRLAGDWNLWRAFAAHEPMRQTDIALGEFTLRSGQLSAVEVDHYRAEIERELPFEARAESFTRAIRAGEFWRERLVTRWPDGALRVQKDRADQIVADAAERTEARMAYAASERHILRKPIRGSAETRIAIAKAGHLVAHDADWQTPAVTERHAFEKMLELWQPASDWAYLGFPWATLIDLRNHWLPERLRLEEALGEAAARLPDGVKVVTVCQHIHAQRVIPLMAGAGVTDLYWSHAVRGQSHLGAVRVRPFPLFPVQSVNGDDVKRDVLFSFVGSRTDAWYPTKTRNWIFESLKSSRRGLILERPGWHYERAVYAAQIRGALGEAPLSEIENEAQFREAMARSLFVLCPSGTGPNTLRLWEAIDSGAIPVVLSDRMEPPGDRSLWEAAVVFFPETEAAVRALPKKLARLARNRRKVAALQDGGRSLKARYGPERFVSDILDDTSGSNR